MVIRTIVLVMLLLVVDPPGVSGQGAMLSDPEIIARIDTALRQLTQIQNEVREIHPYLQEAHPIAIVEGDSLFIFDADPVYHEYTFRRRVPVPFPMVKGIRASFPLASYGGKPTCVVSREVFDSMKGYATILHEFVHCSQYMTCENRLKQALEITRASALSHNYSWEINHPFPYQDPEFVSGYAAYLGALATHDTGTVLPARRWLKQHLPLIDYEYMVWVEWKEGFARFIENEVRSHFGLEANRAGKDQPYDRVAFYFGGEEFIRFLTGTGHRAAIDVEELFRRMAF